MSIVKKNNLLENNYLKTVIIIAPKTIKIVANIFLKTSCRSLK